MGMLIVRNRRMKAENVTEQAGETAETPFEEMTVRELREYADEKGINLEGAQKKREIINKLKGEVEKG